MALQFDTTTRNNWLTTLSTNVGNSGFLDIYTGTPPANCAAGATGTLLAALTTYVSGFGIVASGTLTANAISAATAGASGTAGYFRLTDSGAVVHIQGTVAVSGADLNITNTSIASGDAVSVSSWTITAPGA